MFAAAYLPQVQLQYLQIVAVFMGCMKSAVDSYHSGSYLASANAAEQCVRHCRSTLGNFGGMPSSASSLRDCPCAVADSHVSLIAAIAVW